MGWVQPGVDVIIDSGDDEKPYIAKIVKVDEKRHNVYVTWYYRPEDSLSGRLLFHGKQELFESDHTDWVSVETVVNACNVYSLQEYEEAKINENPDEEKLNFFTRFFFSAKRNRFNECSVRLYCICNQPQNPDKLMISCDSCTDWFHPSCLGIKDKEAMDLETFKCPICMRGYNRESEPQATELCPSAAPIRDA